MSIRWALTLGALFCATSVVAGAFGAHALDGRLTAERLALWRTAAQYLMYAGLGALGSGFLGHTIGTVQRAPGALALIVGGLIFCGTVAILALGGPRWMGAITPIGGLALITGFVLMALSAWRHVG